LAQFHDQVCRQGRWPEPWPWTGEGRRFRIGLEDSSFVNQRGRFTKRQTNSASRALLSLARPVPPSFHADSTSVDFAAELCSPDPHA
jgi:hypothetical protein